MGPKQAKCHGASRGRSEEGRMEAATLALGLEDGSLASRIGLDRRIGKDRADRIVGPKTPKKSGPSPKKKP